MTQVQFNPQLFAEWMNTQDNQNPAEGNTDFLKDDSFLNTLALDPELLAQIAANDVPSSLTSSPVSMNDYESPLSSPPSHLFGSGTESSDDDGMINPMPTEFDSQMVDISPLLSSLSNGSLGYQASTTSAFQNSLLPPLPAIGETQSSNLQSYEPSSPETLSQMAQSKRRKGTAAEAVQFYHNGKFVELNEEELLKLDSSQIDIYIKAIRLAKSLTTAEDKELKRIRRLIKNREYAKNSRVKQKMIVEETQSKISDVQQINDKLQSRINQLEVENRTLRVQLAKVSYAINKDPEILDRIKAATADAPMFQNNNNNFSVNMMQTSTPTATARPTSQTNMNNSAKRKRTTATLFVVLFSFALLLSPLSMFSGTFLNPQESQQITQNWNTGRKVLSFLPEDSVLSHMVAYLPESVQDWLVLEKTEEPKPCSVEEVYDLTPEQEEVYQRITGNKGNSFQFLDPEHEEMPSNDDSLNETTETHDEAQSSTTHHKHEL